MNLSCKIFVILLFGGSVLLINNANAQSNLTSCSNYIEYQVSKSESLESVAEYFGSNEFAALIKSSNPLAFDHSGLINPEITLSIPYKIYHFKDNQWSVQQVLRQPFCDDQEISNKEESNADAKNQGLKTDTTATDKLQQFREAFQSLLEEERTSEQEKAQAKAEQQIFLELDGLVMDETRSKIGRDFYDIFFQQWEAPPNSNNYTITISEKPTPSLGSFISVSVNDRQTFQYRLQPRYEIIEQVANYAVRVTYVYMKDNKHEYIIY